MQKKKSLINQLLIITAPRWPMCGQRGNHWAEWISQPLPGTILNLYASESSSSRATGHGLASEC